jgi:hypothetical protein
MAFSADQHLGAFFNAFANVGLHTIELLLRHHRSDNGLGISRVADREGVHGVRDCALDGDATISLRTKKIKGLHENDFIMAS